MITIRVCEILGIRYPIIQGAVSRGGAELAAAVSEAGGLGTTHSIGTSENLRKQIREIRRFTTKPFSVNLPLREGEKRGREIVQVAIEEKVKVVTSSAGNPALFTRQLKDAGITVMHVVASVAHARKAEEAGVDIIIASGMEAGGWQSHEEITTMTLVPQVVDAVKVPVIAAGGIGDARGFLAALALGAEGIQMGTRFMATSEAPIGQEAQNDILRARDNSTEISGRGRNPLRTFKVDFLKETRPDIEVKQPIGPGGQGGQISGLIREISSARTIVEQIIDEASSVQTRINNIIVGLSHPTVR